MRVQRRVGLGVVLGHLLADQPAGEERGDDLGGGAAAERAGQRQQVAVGPLGGGRENGELGVGKLGHRGSPS